MPLSIAERISRAVDHEHAILYALQADAQPDKPRHRAFLQSLGYHVQAAPYVDLTDTDIPDWYKVWLA